ncbi:MAG: pyridoxamine 5'-phosphate oxidase family protein [Caulobacter sp.]|nr:pyridoxamine 5'-phosphate oxidase family protein [Caulobacter sp.]
MSTDTHDPKAVESRLWAEIEKAHLGMLGIVDGPPQHFQPMTAFVEAEAGEIWFFTRAETDLARDASHGAKSCMFTIQSKDREFQACVGGELTVEMDRAKIAQWWSPMVAAWYPDGKDDPDLRLLRLKCHDARVWISDAGPVKYLWEVARANATGRTPAIGGRADVTLN